MNMIYKESNSKVTNTIFFKHSTMRNESAKMKFIEPNDIKINSHFVLKNIRENTWFTQAEENLSKVYNSHTYNCFISIPTLIHHKSILQFISHQIKDKVHNHHGSLGLLGLGQGLIEILVFLDIHKYLENRRANIKTS